MPEDNTQLDSDVMDEATGSDAETSAGAARKGSKAGTLVVMVVGFLVMFLTPLISYFVVKASLPPEAVTADRAVDNGEPVLLKLDEIMVNIANTQATRILRFEPHLLLSESRLHEKLSKNLLPMVHDRIMRTASSKSIDQLEGPHGRESLKRDIMAQINEEIKSMMCGAVVDIYFTDFLIQ